MSFQTVASVLLMGYVVVAFGRRYLPAKFSADSAGIQRIAQYGPGPFVDKSFTNMGVFYRELGLTHREDLAGILGYTIAAVGLLTVAWRMRHTPARTAVVGVMIIATFFSAIYLGTYSKDVVVALVVLVVLWAPKGRPGSVVIVGVMALYAFFFRDYWYLVIVVYLSLSWLIVNRRKFARRHGLRRKHLLMLMIVIVAAISLAIVVLSGVPADYYRTTTNAERALAPDAATQIRPFLSAPEPFGSVINNVLTYLALMLPIPLAALGGAYYAVLAVMLGAVWAWFWTALKIITGDRHLPTHLVRAIALVLSFSAVQSVFEPDYGSALRHLTPLWPLILLTIWWAQGRSESDPLYAEIGASKTGH